MATKRQGNFAFVTVNSSGKVVARDRKLIRSHCMQGKNMTIGRRKIIAPVLVKSRQDSAVGQYPSLQPSSPESEEIVSTISKSQDQNVTNLVEPNPSIPPPCPPDFALVRFACDVNRDSQELIFNSMNQGKDSMYPIELSVDFDLCRSLWFQWLFWDPAYLYCVLWGASATRDYLKRTPSKLTHMHFIKAIKHLNKKLSDNVLGLYDSTVAVVVMMTMVAGMTGDEPTAMAHVAGLKSMVRERGGIDAFRHNPKLHMKIGRVDLAYSLITGQDSMYFNGPLSLDPIFDLSTLCGVPCGNDPVLYGIHDGRVTTIFRDLQYYTTIINQANLAEQRRPAAEFQDVICSIQYRLMQLQGRLEDLSAECLRLGMLTFLTTTFQISGIGFQYPYLADRFRECCLAVEAVTPQRRDLMRWLLIMGSIALYGTNEEWLRKCWQFTGPKTTWPQVRHCLKQIIWIDAIHDKTGRSLFENLSS